MNKTQTRGHRVEKFWCLVGIDRDGDEGLCGLGSSMGTVQAVISEARLLPQMRQLGRMEAAKRPDMKFVLRVFENGTDLEEF